MLHSWQDASIPPGTLMVLASRCVQGGLHQGQPPPRCYTYSPIQSTPELLKRDTCRQKYRETLETSPAQPWEKGKIHCHRDLSMSRDIVGDAPVLGGSRRLPVSRWGQEHGPTAQQHGRGSRKGHATGDHLHVSPATLPITGLSHPRQDTCNEKGEGRGEGKTQS